MRIDKTRHFTYLALLSAMAITLNLLETAMIPPLFGVFRIGLANIIALVTLKILGVKDMIIVNIMRVMIGNLLSGRIFGSTFWISFGGVLLHPLVHEVGLVIAILLGALGLGQGVARHGYIMPFAVGCFGLGMMAGAMSLGHGDGELAATLAGVIRVEFGSRISSRC